MYRLSPGMGDSELYLRHLSSGNQIEIPRGSSAEFSDDSQFVVFQIEPVDSIVKELRLADTRQADLPKDSLGILDLDTGTIVRVARVRSFALPAEEGGWVAYLHETPAEPDSAEAGEEVEGRGARRGGGNGGGDDKPEGTRLVLRSLGTGATWEYDDVVTYAFADNGSLLAYTASNEEGDADGVFVVTPGTEAATPLMAGAGIYKNLTIGYEGDQLAFVSNRDEFEADQPAFQLYHWNGSGDARTVANATTSGIPGGWWVSEHGSTSFSADGRRLFFGTAPRPEPEPEEEVPEWEKVELDVWHWQDPLLQPNQLVDIEDDRRRSYRAVVHLDSDRVVQLATINRPNITVADSGRGDVGLAVTNMPYRQRISWDSPNYNDTYIVDVITGQARRVLEDIQASPDLSPSGEYVTWWDGAERAWFAMRVSAGSPINLTSGINVPFHDELHDRPMIPGSNGSVGWTPEDERFLVYDTYDIWALDPTGQAGPRNVTEGVGRRDALRFRHVDVDRAGGFGFGGFGGSDDVIQTNEDILLSAFDMESKASGFYRDRVQGTEQPRLILMDDKDFGSPQKAEDADVVIFTRESFQEFPDLWASNLQFGNPQRVSHANPQQDNYLWGTAELVSWTSTDGLPLEGLLYKPENFDPARQYPMMVYYYEKNSDNLHRHRAPAPGSSSIDISFYVSRGYVVFVPDIYYSDGYPGESALDCIVPGVLSLIAQGFVDPERVGAQGHSWGGYQNAFLVTRTNIFAAVEAGAPVSNMTSAYGGVRWASGRIRAMQYERTQSRLGGSLWEVQPRYIENSPIFWVDKIETPVLMMHNDEDGAVPWYQGIELFAAMRRLQKPVWMLNYNGEAHGLREYKNRKDFAVRMQQFFDHYLMDAPPPVWLEEGIPAVRKGLDNGLQLISEPTTGQGTSGR
jgi:dipeptidyl aminopeptidase/acylaminoacyl peptidase